MHTTSYNNIPYQSLPVSYTYLPHLAGLGRLFGLETVDPERCRVLEIGCAEANNIIPMAWHLPESEFVGIDLSDVQIDKGKQLIESLALKNIQLHVQDVTALVDNPHFSDVNTSNQEDLGDTKLGYKKFDYILLHGVFSWVSREDQQTLLATAKSLLSESGLIYISYNTYPGWHAQMVLRDAMKLYSSQYGKPEEKRSKIREGIVYFKDFFKVANNEFSAYNTKRLATLEKDSSRYLYHEFLEEHNHPLYIEDFVKKVNNEGLQYVSDALLAFDSPVLLGEKRNAYISDKPGRIERLQYMDFMLNQRFRRSILSHTSSHASQSIRDEFAPEHMAKLAFRGSFRCKRDLNLVNDRPCKFYQDGNQGVFMSLCHPVSKAAALILSESHPASMMYMDLLQASCQRVAVANTKGNHSSLASENPLGGHAIKKIELFYHEFYLLLINDWVSLDTKASRAIAIDWNKPLYISDLSWQYASHTGFIPSFLLNAVDVDDFGIQILRLLRKGIVKQDLLDKMVSLGRQANAKKRNLWTFTLVKYKERQIKAKVYSFLDTLENQQLLTNVM